MRLSTQFRISLVFFTIILVIIAASALLTSQQVANVRAQENLANSIVRGASDLAYLSNDFVVYRGEQQLDQWQTRYVSLSNDVGNLSATTAEQQALLSDIKSSQQNLKAVFENIVSLIGSSPSTQPSSQALQTSWSRISIQSQTLILDATRLAQSFTGQVDHLNEINFVLIFSAIVTFSAFIVVIYMQAFRRTLRSISDLEAGTKIIGSGNLDYKLKESGKDEIGNLSRAFNQMTDSLKAVTASKNELENAQEALGVSEGRFRLALRNSPITLIELDNDLRFKWVYNPLVGRNSDELIGKKIGESGTTQDVTPLRTFYEEVLHEGKAKRSEIKLEHSDRVAYYDIYAEPIRNQTSMIIGLASVSTDITELKKAEEALRQAQAKLQEYAHGLERIVDERTRELKESERMVAIGQTAGMVGHDIRNPLQSILGDLYLLQMDIEAMPEGSEKTEAIDIIAGIDDNVAYINKIVADLQDYARKTMPSLSEVDLEDAIEKAFSTITVPSNIKTECLVEPETKIKTDPAYIRRIITNLSTNAIQAMPNGGKLRINAKKNNHSIEITVSDTGEGIPEDVQDKVFKPLFTTKSKGQGFGLAVVKKFVEELGGTIAFDSELGKGTKFIISFPVDRDKKT